MDENTNSPRRTDRRTSLKKKSSLTSEHRYESLQSLSRLVEDDFKTEMETARRVSLPALNESFLVPELTTGLWRRNSSVVDHMQELTTKRREMIQRLIPDIEGRKNSSWKENGDCDTILCHGGHKSSNSICRNVGQIPTINEGTDLASKLCTESDKMETNDNDEEDAMDILRDRIAKFESMKSIPRSINADDFQQFLGARYLEIYQKRASHSNITKESGGPYRYEINSAQEFTKQNNGKDDSSRGRNNRSLNAKIHSLAQQNHSRLGSSYSNGQNLKVTLPPIFKDNDSKFAVDKKRHVLEIDKKYQHGSVPIHNDLAVGGSDRCHTKGIPHHTAKRANKRYHESREINSILNELRRLSSTVQKSEQEEFLNKLEEDD